MSTGQYLPNGVTVRDGSSEQLQLSQQGNLKTHLAVALDSTNDSVTVYNGANSTVAGLDTIYQAALTNSVVGVKTSTGRLFGWDLSAGGSVAAEYVQIFDLNTTSVTLGTTVPKLSIMIPIASKDEKAFTIPITFATAISVAATATAGGSGAPATTINANWFYK